MTDTVNGVALEGKGRNTTNHATVDHDSFVVRYARMSRAEEEKMVMQVLGLFAVLLLMLVVMACRRL